MQWQYLLTPFVIHPRSINLFCFPIRHDLRTLQNMFLFFVKTCRVFSLLIAAVTAHLYINLRIWFVTLLFMYSIINIYAYSLNTITSSPNVDQRQTKLLNCDVHFGYFFLKIKRLFKLMLISSVMHETSMLLVLFIVIYIIR